MVKDHARKNDARARAAATGETHREAVQHVRHDQQRWIGIIDYPRPAVIDGVPACQACEGAGLGETRYEMAAGEVALQVAPVCGVCHGCGRAIHDQCVPGDHATDDPHEAAEYLSESADLEEAYAWASGGDLAETCPSCQGARFWYATGFNPDMPEAKDAAHDRLLDDLFGEHAADEEDEPDGGLVYLKIPCGCAEDLVTRRLETA